MAAYALARMEFPGKKLLFGLIVAHALRARASILIIPNFLIVDDLGWLDTLWALVVPSAGGAFGVFFLRQFFLSLPRELEEAALARRRQPVPDLLPVVLPLCPAGAWPRWPCCRSSPTGTTSSGRSTCCSRRASSPCRPGLPILQGAYTTNYPVVMAGAVVASVPVLILFVFAQRYVIDSVARSGLKG